LLMCLHHSSDVKHILVC